MIEIITGRSGSGKSRYITDGIRRRICADPLKKILVICPEQYTFQMERDIMQDIPGMLGCEVLSVSRLTHRILECSGFSGETVDACAMTMQIAMILQKGDFASFERSKAQGGVESALYNTISEMKRYDITPEHIKEHIKDISNTLLAGKMKDIAEIYSRLKEQNRDKFDAEDLLNEAIALVPSLPLFDGCTLAVDGFDMITPQVKRMLYALTSRADDMMITFRCGSLTDADAAILSAQRTLMDEFIEHIGAIGKKAEIKQFPCEAYAKRHVPYALRFLEKNLYSYPSEKYTGEKEGIELKPCAAAASEIRECARSIFELTRKGGYRYKDIAVAAPPGYTAQVRQAFASAGIPCFADVQWSVTQSGMYILLSSALQLVSGRWSMFVLTRYLKCGLLNISSAEAARLLVFMRRYGLRAYSLKREIKPPDEQWADIEEIRQRAMAPVLAYSAERLRTGNDCAGYLRFLVKETGAATVAAEATAKWEAAGLGDNAAAGEQAVKKLFDIIDKTANVIGSDECGLRTYIRLFESACALASISVIPPKNDEVAIVALGHTKMRATKALYVLGANEGEYDSTEPAGAIPLAEANALTKADIDFIRHDRLCELKADVYELLSKPSELLIISYIDSKPEWSVVSRIRGITGIAPKTAVHGEIGCAPPNIMAAELIGSCFGAEKKSDAAKAYATLRRYPVWREAVDRLVSSKPDDNVPIAKADVSKLLGDMHGTVTRIEEFSRCPFRHFAKYAMGLEPEREFKDTSRDWGSILHEALDHMAGEIRKKGVKWGELERDEVRSIAAAEVDKIFTGFSGGRFSLSAREEFYRELAREQAKLCAEVIARQFAKTAADVAASEVYFGRDIPGITVDMGGGATATFTGKIDRVDEAVIDGIRYLRVVDYKLSARSFDMSGLYYGVSIQLMTYLMVLIENSKDAAIGAGAYYFDLSNTLSAGGEDAIFDKKRMNGITLDDPKVAIAINGLSGKKLLAIKQNVTKEGNLDNQYQKVFSNEDLHSIFSYLHMLINAKVSEMADGRAEPAPYCSETGDAACIYCDYASVCQYDALPERAVKRDLSDILAALRGDGYGK